MRVLGHTRLERQVVEERVHLDENLPDSYYQEVWSVFHTHTRGSSVLYRHGGAYYRAKNRRVEQLRDTLHRTP